VITIGAANKASSWTRSNTCWNVERRPTMGTNCLGRLSRDTGHSRVPAPPHMITGKMRSDTLMAPFAGTGEKATRTACLAAIWALQLAGRPLWACTAVNSGPRNLTSGSDQEKSPAEWGSVRRGLISRARGFCNVQAAATH
jgi:hypothetical protein